jgi:hypothetical protein
MNEKSDPWASPPSALYRYMSFEYLAETLRRNEVYFPAPQSFNDPFDFKIQPIISAARDTRKALYDQALKSTGVNRAERRRRVRARARKGTLKDKLFQDAYRKTLQDLTHNCGVLCLSSVSDDILMWSHYAESHKGVCIGIETAVLDIDSASVCRIWQVDYQADYPKVDFLKLQSELASPDPAIKERAEDLMIRGLFLTKAEHWSYESEWRWILAQKNRARTCGWRNIPFVALSEIISGARIEEESLSRLPQLLSKSLFKPKIRRAKVSGTRFALEIAEP